MADFPKDPNLIAWLRIQQELRAVQLRCPNPAKLPAMTRA